MSVELLLLYPSNTNPFIHPHVHTQGPSLHLTATTAFTNPPNYTQAQSEACEANTFTHVLA